ncbi:putative ankyrin repeat-containing domain, PGG domain, ankyrin repeat-containing domain superfamily [Helianthus annuus]|nr:putative ankyrin repeat-containing domain, PGG domain, ankyrin repeat-containing domain superfamily [Helianthus annuus]
MEMGGSSNALDVSAQTHDMKFMQASNINVSNFVSVKLSGHSNYKIWKAQMLCLVESQLLLHIISDQHPFPVDKGVHMISQYDKLVKGWIFGSVNHQVLEALVDSSTAQEVWMDLEDLFNLPVRNKEGDLWDPYGVCVPEHIEASKINVSSFVSVKLSGRNNFKIWKVQMLGLIQSQGLLQITEDGNSITKNYHSLVKGWISTTMNDKVLEDFTNHLDSPKVQNIWRKLESTFEKPLVKRDIFPEHVAVNFKFRTEPTGGIPEIENIDRIRRERLYEAAVDGCWWKAKSILKINRNAATEVIHPDGNTILHVAIEMGNNYLVEKLLEFLEGTEIEKKNHYRMTALHVAGMVGNTDAAQLLVQKRKELLEIPDRDQEEPFHTAFQNAKLSTCAYLLRCAPPSSSAHEHSAVVAAILTKQYDLARIMLNKFPSYARGNPGALMAITISFPTDLSFMESLIYPSFQDVCHKTVMGVSLLFHSNFLDRCVEDILRVVKICNNMCCNWMGKNSMIIVVPIVTLYPIYQLICLLILVLHSTFSMLYYLFWKFLAVTVHPIKNIEKKKKQYKEAKDILSLICDQMGEKNVGYHPTLNEAVLQGAYEVVDEILFRSPATINFKDEEGHNIIQLAILNRSEKVYNLIYHIIERTEFYRTMKDSSDNNLVHLAGKLAPSFVLERTAGAALQLQQELLWFEEVKKLLLPFQLMLKNKNKETPAMVFKKEHLDLMKEGEIWMKTTAESCSITAALIVTVVFAAAITVPGGNQESGLPLFKEKTSFTIFAVFNAFSLFTSATALLLFLSILTARFSEKDFLVSLPRRLIFGLMALFISTTAMMVAFGAILFLVFCDKRPWMLAPICAFACLPISVIVTIKVPLLVDLIQSTYSPIFGKHHYLESCKVNRKNTIFMDRRRGFLGGQ